MSVISFLVLSYSYNVFLRIILKSSSSLPNCSIKSSFDAFVSEKFALNASSSANLPLASSRDFFLVDKSASKGACFWISFVSLSCKASNSFLNVFRFSICFSAVSFRPDISSRILCRIAFCSSIFLSIPLISSCLREIFSSASLIFPCWTSIPFLVFSIVLRLSWICLSANTIEEFFRAIEPLISSAFCFNSSWCPSPFSVIVLEISSYFSLMSLSRSSKSFDFNSSSFFFLVNSRIFSCAFSIFLRKSKNLTVFIWLSKPFFSSLSFWYFSATSFSSLSCSRRVLTSLRIRVELTTRFSTVSNSFVACSIRLSKSAIPAISSIILRRSPGVQFVILITSPCIITL